MDRWSALGTTQRLALSGTIWTLTAFGGAQLLRFAGSLVTTRLLFPELFGLMAIVQSVLMAIAMFSDVGLSDNVVRGDRGDDRKFLANVFAVQAMRGVALWLVCVAAAPFVASFYGDARIAWVLPVTGLSATIAGFQSTSVMLMRKRMEVRRLALLELMAQAIGLAVVILWALADPSIWALVAGGLSSSIAKVAGSHVLNCPNRDRFGFDRAVLRELFSWGRWIFISTMFTFLAGQTDRLILGKLFSLDFLGIYNIAFMLSDVPRAIMIALSSRVILPTFAMSKHLPRVEAREKIRSRRRWLLAFAALALGSLVGAGDVLVVVLYDPRWSDAGWILQILAIGVWPLILAWSMDPMLFVLGKVHYPALGNALRFVLLCLLSVTGAWLGGEVGAVVGVAVSVLPVLVVSKIGLWREGYAYVRQDLIGTGLFVATAALTYGACELIKSYSASQPLGIAG
nr:oligosaccharide flippase family protein [Sphingomonas hankyongi]